MAAGQRPINNVVDITNYVMLLTGQPLHAFDLDRVAGGRLVVRRAPRGRAGRRRSTASRARSTPTMLVIADDDGPTSIAGVMGGARSEVARRHHARADGGRHLERAEHPAHLVEARPAHARPPARFEKGLSPERRIEAQAVAAEADGRADAARRSPRARSTSATAGPAARVGPRCATRASSGCSGIADRPRERSAEILEALGFGVSGRRRRARRQRPALAPRRRHPRGRPRRGGRTASTALEKLPATLPGRAAARPAARRPAQRLRRRAEDALAGRGLLRGRGLVVHRPTLPTSCARRADDAGALVSQNPMSEEQAVMRPKLFGSLLDTARAERPPRADLRAHVRVRLRLLRRAAPGRWPPRHARAGPRGRCPTSARTSARS